MTPHPRTPRAEARAEAQRERILAAAQQCFVERGFHAASMAMISETAQMSAGLIYRYFDGKDAIILAIIERQLEENRASLASLGSVDDLIERLCMLLPSWRSGGGTNVSPVLLLEMSAQAGRDPQIGAALARADAILRADLADWLERSSVGRRGKLAPAERHARVLALQCFMEGIFVRSVREPELDLQSVVDALRRFLLETLELKA